MAALLGEMRSAAVRTPRWLPLAALLVGVPLAATLAVYVRYVDTWLWTDDFLWFEAAKNPDLAGSLREAFELPRGATPYWRPLVDFYFFCMYRVVGLNADAYHIANLVMHISIASMLGVLLLRLRAPLLACVVAAALFAVSPTYVAMVPWTSGVTALLSGVFALATLVLFAVAVQKDAAYRWLAPALGTFFAAVLSKEDAVALVPVMAMIALIVRHPHDREGWIAMGRSLAPFLVLALAFGLLQITQVVGSDDSSRYHIGWNAMPRLGQALRWMSLPWPTWYAEWVDPAQWAAFLVFILVAAYHLLRRQWVAPFLYASTVLLLLPSCFLTSTFAARWTYLATATWAGFLGVALVSPLRDLSGWKRNAAGGVVASIAMALIVVLAQRTVDSQSWVAGTAAEYERVHSAVSDGCGDDLDGRRLFFVELPIPDPGYAVSSLARLYHDAVPRRVTIGNLSRVPAPGVGDCVLYWTPVGGYATTTVAAGHDGLAFWLPPSNPDLVAPIETWPVWRGTATPDAEGVLLTSLGAVEYGAISPSVALNGSVRYVGSVWVKGVDFSPGDQAVIAIAPPNEAPLAIGTVKLSDTWQRIIVGYRPPGAEAATLRLGITHKAATATSASFLVRDAELRQFGLNVATP